MSNDMAIKPRMAPSNDDSIYHIIVFHDTEGVRSKT